MTEAGIYIKRVFDTPTGLVVIMIVFTILSIIACVNVDSLIMFPSEKYGYYLATIMAVCGSAYLSHIWLWGRKVTYGSIDLK